jgi:hypothetical protein
VIVREDLLGPGAADHALGLRLQDRRPTTTACYNTPPTYAIYVAGLVFQWIKARGGLPAMEAHNRAKAALLYDFLDATGFYRSPVQRDCRSLMNVPFKLQDESLDAAFLKGAEARGLVQLKGHRSVGGMRASIYNAMPIEGVQALVAWMKDFEASMPERLQVLVLNQISAKAWRGCPRSATGSARTSRRPTPSCCARPTCTAADPRQRACHRARRRRRQQHPGGGR